MEWFSPREYLDVVKQQSIEQQKNLLSIDITKEDINHAYARVKLEFDKAYQAPQIDKTFNSTEVNPVQNLVDSKKLVLDKQNVVNSAQETWNKNLKLYKDQKLLVENVISEMSTKQTDIKRLAAKDPIMSDKLRREFTSLKNDFDVKSSKLKEYKGALDLSYPNLEKALSVLADQKKLYATVVIESRKAHRETIIQWNKSDLSTYRTQLDTQQTNIKKELDDNTASTGTKVGNDEIKKRDIKKVVKEIGSLWVQETNYRSQYFERVYDSTLYDAVAYNKSMYQIVYLTELKKTLQGDLELAKMPSSDLVKDLLEAKNLLLEPTTNNKADIAKSSEWYQFPEFVYKNYKDAVFSIDDSMTEWMEKVFDEWRDRNSYLSDFQSSLTLSLEEKAILDKQHLFEDNLKWETYRNLVKLISYKTWSQVNGSDVIDPKSNLDTLTGKVIASPNLTSWEVQKTSYLSVAGRLLLYRNTLKAWFDALNVEHKRLQWLLTRGDKLSQTQISKISKWISDIRSIREDLGKFWVFTSDDKAIIDLIKGDKISSLVPEFDIENLLSKLPKADLKLNPITDQYYVPSSLEWKWLSKEDRVVQFDNIKLDNSKLSYKVLIDKPEQYGTQMTYAREEEINTLNNGFDPVRKRLAEVLENTKKII